MLSSILFRAWFFFLSVRKKQRALGGTRTTPQHWYPPDPLDPLILISPPRGAPHIGLAGGDCCCLCGTCCLVVPGRGCASVAGLTAPFGRLPEQDGEHGGAQPKVLVSFCPPRSGSNLPLRRERSGLACPRAFHAHILKGNYNFNRKRGPRGIVQMRLPSGELPKAKHQAMLDEAPGEVQGIVQSCVPCGDFAQRKAQAMLDGSPARRRPEPGWQPPSARDDLHLQTGRNCDIMNRHKRGGFTDEDIEAGCADVVPVFCTAG